MEALIKYLNTIEGFQEVPGQVSLLINISLCENKCIGCHSPDLQTDAGQPLTEDALDFYLGRGPYTCVCLMGEGNDKEALIEVIQWINERGLKTAIYSGRDIDVADWCQEYGLVPDYLKVGSYKEELGPLNKKTTNQRMYHCSDSFEDITYKFWKGGK